MTLSTKKFIVACIWAGLTVGTTLSFGVNWFSYVGCFMSVWIVRHQLWCEIDPDEEEYNKNNQNNS